MPEPCPTVLSKTHALQNLRQRFSSARTVRRLRIHLNPGDSHLRYAGDTPRSRYQTTPLLYQIRPLSARDSACASVSGWRWRQHRQPRSYNRNIRYIHSSPAPSVLRGARKSRADLIGSRPGVWRIQQVCRPAPQTVGLPSSRAAAAPSAASSSASSLALSSSFFRVSRCCCSSSSMRCCSRSICLSSFSSIWSFF